MAIIDRDPDEMMKFAKCVSDYAARTSGIITTVKLGIGHYNSIAFDPTCTACGEKVLEDCEAYLDQLEVYRELARQIERNAKRMRDIIDNTQF